MPDLLELTNEVNKLRVDLRATTRAKQEVTRELIEARKTIADLQMRLKSVELRDETKFITPVHKLNALVQPDEETPEDTANCFLCRKLGVNEDR